MKISPREWPWPTRLLSAAVIVAGAALGASLHAPIPVQRLADDPALVPPLPDAALQRAPRRATPAAIQADIAARPLFSSTRRPAPMADAGAPEAVPFDYVLTSVIVTDQAGIAILRGPDDRSVSVRREAEVETAPGWRLVELEPRRAVFVGPGGRRALDLRTYDGRGGAAPTPLEPMPPREPVVTRTPESGPDPPVPATRPATGVRTAPDSVADTDTDSIRERAELRRAQRRRNSPSP
jgi:general secretion pathway protein N